MIKASRNYKNAMPKRLCFLNHQKMGKMVKMRLLKCRPQKEAVSPQQR